MKRTSHIWLVFGTCLGTIVSAMVWLTIKARELDRSEGLASARADLEEEISLTLWRMDSMLAPLLAAEAARPYDDFLAVAPVRDLDPRRASQLVPSPLLVATPPNVLLHFQFDPNGQWSSPQLPMGDSRSLALEQGISPDFIASNSRKLDALQQSLSDPKLIEQLVQFASSGSGEQQRESYYAPAVPAAEAGPAEAGPAEAGPAESAGESLARRGHESSGAIALPGPAMLPQRPVPEAAARPAAARFSQTDDSAQLLQPPGVELEAAGVVPDRDSDLLKDRDGKRPATRSSALALGSAQSAAPADGVGEPLAELNAAVPGAGGRSESMVAEPSEVVPAAPLSQDAAFRRAKTRGAEISGGGGYGGGLESGAFEKERLVEGRGDLGDRATRSAQKQETAERAPPLRQEESDPTFAYRASGYGIGSQVARATNTISRSEREFENRQRSMRENIRQFTENERNEFGDGSAGEDNDLLQRVSMGNGRPVWVGSNLLFARTVLIDDRKIIQGCWLDWQRIERMLLAEASHLPGARLIPVTETAQTNLGHMLATLPVRLEVDFVPEPISGLTPIRISLLVTWICLLFAFLALSALLLGVIRLSERRAAFVSAVTHELRTPLTTFRIYSDMLADDMVSDANQRRQYLQTLRSEADRLRHMVENVLAYARLERGRSDQRSTIQVDRLSERTVPRLSERAANAGMEFVARLDPDAAEKTLYVNATVIEQILFNLVDNACKYAREAANPKIDFDVESDADQIRFTIRDYGPGLPVKRRWQNWRPFSKTVEEAAHTAPGIGLGLALCQRLAIDSGGSLQVDNAPPSDAPGTIAALRLPVAKG